MNRRQQPAAWMRTMLALALLVCASPAFAYLDPSTGSMVVSAIVGIFASIALALKTYWYRLKNLFKGKSRNTDESGAGNTRNTPGEG